MIQSLTIFQPIFGSIILVTPTTLHGFSSSLVISGPSEPYAYGYVCLYVDIYLRIYNLFRPQTIYWTYMAKNGHVAIYDNICIHGWSP